MNDDTEEAEGSASVRDRLNVPEDAGRIMEWLVGNAHGAVSAGAVTEVTILVEIGDPVEIVVRVPH